MILWSSLLKYHSRMKHAYYSFYSCIYDLLSEWTYSFLYNTGSKKRFKNRLRRFKRHTSISCHQAWWSRCAFPEAYTPMIAASWNIVFGERFLHTCLILAHILSTRFWASWTFALLECLCYISTVPIFLYFNGITNNSDVIYAFCLFPRLYKPFPFLYRKDSLCELLWTRIPSYLCVLKTSQYFYGNTYHSDY